MHAEIRRNEEKLGHLFDQARALQQNGDVDSELRTQFVWYLCVRTCGYLEESLRMILLDFFESRQDHPQINDFVSNQLGLSREFQFRRVRGLVKSFSDRQRNGSNEIDYSRLDSSMASLQTNRNKIAHGNDAQLTLNALSGYYKDAQQVVRVVYEECNSLRA